MSKKSHESSDGKAKARPIAEVTREHGEALTVLKDLKSVEPRDADAVLQQKLVVQALAAEIAAHGSE